MEEALWEDLRKELRNRVPSHLYESLVKPARPQTTLDGKGLDLKFSDQFSKENFERKCMPALLEVLAQRQLEISLACHVEAAERTAPSHFHYNTHGIASAETSLFDGRYSFETFIVGNANQFAHAACQSVAQSPGKSYNPLFLFGGAGLGKTHLMKAIGYHLSRPPSRERILYLSTEEFTNELIQAIRTDKMREFRDTYRYGCEVLLLDDIQFLAGKERTQEEFFYTFNALHELGCQMVMSADRYPKDIPGLEDRLKTRFEWGLVADIQPPEMETRLAILHSKAVKQHIVLNPEVAQFIATNITSNIRELEGALHRLEAFATITQQKITLELATHLLKDIAPIRQHELTKEGVLKLVALEFNVGVHDLRSDKRIRKLTLPRQVCMYLLRKHFLMSFPEIGRFMGGKDHTTVLHAVTKIAELQKNDPSILQHITTIEGLFH